jgi:hypothetical protein
MIGDSQKIHRYTPRSKLADEIVYYPINPAVTRSGHENG